MFLLFFSAEKRICFYFSYFILYILNRISQDKRQVNISTTLYVKKQCFVIIIVYYYISLFKIILQTHSNISK